MRSSGRPRLSSGRSSTADRASDPLHLGIPRSFRWGRGDLQVLRIAQSTFYAAKARAPSAWARRATGRRDRARARRELRHLRGGEGLAPAAARMDRGRPRSGRLADGRPGSAWVRRGKFKRTTINDQSGARPADLVQRRFRAPAPTGCGWPISSATRRSRTEWGWETFTVGPSQRPGSSWGQADPGDASEGGKQAPTTTRRVSTVR
jgi:hypothetical protein